MERKVETWWSGRSARNRALYRHLACAVTPNTHTPHSDGLGHPCCTYSPAHLRKCSDGSFYFLLLVLRRFPVALGEQCSSKWGPHAGGRFARADVVCWWSWAAGRCCARPNPHPPPGRPRKYARHEGFGRTYRRQAALALRGHGEATGEALRLPTASLREIRDL